MKKITLLGIALLISYIGQSQDTRLGDLLTEYENLHSTPYPINNFFNGEEIAILQDHFSQQNEIEESRAGVANDVTIFGTNTGTDTFISFNTATFNVLTGINQALLSTIPITDFETGGDINPQNLNEAFVITFEGRFYRLDITTGVYTLLGLIPAPRGETWTGLEFDPTTNILYGISGSFDFPVTAALSTINIDDLSLTMIGDVDIMAPISIVTDGDGNFYIHDLSENTIFSVDPNTAEVTQIGTTGQLGFNASFGNDMEWDDATDTLWMTAFNFAAVSPELRTVDPATGTSTLLGRIGDDPIDRISWGSIQNISTLSVNDNSISQVSISPNPTQGLLNINAQAPMGQITIYNSLGQNVATYTANNLQTYSVDTAGMANGLYVIELNTTLGTVTEKFVKQ